MISAAIIAHPARRDYVKELRRQIHAPVVWDKKQDMWDTARRAILEYDPAATHHVIVDDDALPAAYFLEGIESMVEHLPQPTLVGLFVGEDIRLQVMLNGHRGNGGDFDLSTVSFLQFGGVLNWGVATVIPTEWIPDMVDYCDTLPFPEVDRRMGTFANALRYPTLYTWPSIVDHRKGPSLRSASYIRVGLNVADDARQDWSGSILGLPFDSRVPYTPREMQDLRKAKRRMMLAAAQPSS